MSDVPRVSIVVNALDGERYLAEALESALAQTFRGWDLVVWDDRSSDGTADVVRSYDDPRIRYRLAPERTHLGIARRDAIATTRGDWIAFLDQDDVWAPDKLERQLALVDAEGGAADLGIVYGRATTLSVGGRERDHDLRLAYRPLPEGDIFAVLFEKPGFILMSSALVSRRAYDAVGGISGVYEVAVDYALFTDVARRFRARALQEPCCRYRLHDDNMSDSFSLQVCEEVLAILDRWADELDPRIARRRRLVYETLLGLQQIGARGEWGAGVLRILTRGSLPYLLVRPVVPMARALRRSAMRLMGKGFDGH